MMATKTNHTFSSKAKDDLDLVRRAVQGNQSAYYILMNRYRNGVHRLILKMVNNRADAEDLTMEAFGKAFIKLPYYEPHYAFSTWLYKIAYNNCIDHVRKKRPQVVHAGDLLGKSGYDTDLMRMFPSDARSVEEEIIRDQQHDLVREMLSQLSERYRQMILLRFFDDMSYDEIAQQLDLPLGTVKAQLYRAKETLYQMMQKPIAKCYFERTARPDKSFLNTDA